MALHCILFSLFCNTILIMGWAMVAAAAMALALADRRCGAAAMACLGGNRPAARPKPPWWQESQRQRTLGVVAVAALAAPALAFQDATVQLVPAVAGPAKTLPSVSMRARQQHRQHQQRQAASTRARPEPAPVAQHIRPRHQAGGQRVLAKTCGAVSFRARGGTAPRSRKGGPKRTRSNVRPRRQAQARHTGGGRRRVSVRVAMS